MEETCEMRLVLTPELRNKYGKWVDKETGKFMKWAKSPKTTKEMENRQREILDFLRNNRHKELNDKELHRLLKIYSKPHLGIEQEFYHQTMLGLQI